MYRTFFLHRWLPMPVLQEATTVSPGAGGSGSPSGAPSGGSPTSPSPPSGTPSPAGAQPAANGQGSPAATSPANQGPVAYERFNEVNERLRKLEWAESYADPDVVQRATQLWDWFDTDPAAAYDFLTSSLTRAGHIQRPQPQGGNGNGQGTQSRFTAADGRPLPDVVIQETGQKFYSADQQEKLLDWKIKQLDSRLAPLESSNQSAQATSEARAQLNEAEKWPYFSDFAEDVFKEMKRDRRLTLEGAYNRVVVPKIRVKERESVIAEMQRQGQASTTNPGSQTASVPAEDSKKSLQQLFKEEMRKRGMGS